MECNATLVLTDGGEVKSAPPAPGKGCTCENCNPKPVTVAEVISDEKVSI